jgi:hypothetical protein
MREDRWRGTNEMKGRDNGWRRKLHDTALLVRAEIKKMFLATYGAMVRVQNFGEISPKFREFR